MNEVKLAMPNNVRIWRSPAITPVLDTDAYSAVDAIGTKQQVSGAPSMGIIRAITISDDSDQASDINLWVFDSEPTGIADDANFALADADLQRVIDLVVGDTRRDGINGLVTVEYPNIPYKNESGELWFQMACVGTPTYAADALNVRFVIEY